MADDMLSGMQAAVQQLSHPPDQEGAARGEVCSPGGGWYRDMG